MVFSGVTAHCVLWGKSTCFLGLGHIMFPGVKVHVRRYEIYM